MFQLGYDANELLIFFEISGLPTGEAIGCFVHLVNAKITTMYKKLVKFFFIKKLVKLAGYAPVATDILVNCN